MEQPAPEMWSEVADMVPEDIQWCCLFEDDCNEKSSGGTSQSASWKALRYPAFQTQMNPK